MTHEIKKHDWTYIAHIADSEIKFEVIPAEKFNKTPFFHKLFALSPNSVDSLLGQYIYATHPFQFNDIFDCHEDLIEFDHEDAIRFFITEYADTLISKEKMEDMLKNNFKEISTFVKRNFREMIYANFGIFSMTSNPESLLMWSYYTNHQGFFIEYDISKFPFKYHGPFPLNYQEKIDPISIKECGIPLAVLLQSNLKYKGWEHENEWRIIVESKERMIIPSFEHLKNLGGKERKFNYPIEAIRTVGFGNRFFPPEELRIENDKVMHVTLKKDIELKSKILDFLIANKINTCFAERNGLMKISFGGMDISKTNDTTYVFSKENWVDRRKA